MDDRINRVLKAVWELVLHAGLYLAGAVVLTLIVRDMDSLRERFPLQVRVSVVFSSTLCLAALIKRKLIDE